MKPSETLKSTIYSGADAETISEIHENSGGVKSLSTIRVHARKMVKQGSWREVLVKRPGVKGLLKAYVVEKKK